MAVAYSTDTDVTPSTGSAPTASITVSGTNPVLLVGVSLADLTATVSSVTWSGGGGTPTEIKNIRNDNAAACFSSVWAVPAPGVGAGTVTVNLSASVPYQINVALFTGADQTTPCPVADAQSSIAQSANLTLTPTNLTANDASYGWAGSRTGNPTGVTPTQLFLNSTTDVNAEGGYATGTTGVTFTHDSSPNDHTYIAVRIVAATAPTSQLAAPTSDISAGNWVRSSDGTGTGLYTMLDEASPGSDTDYVYVNSDSTMEVKFASVSDPAISTGHKVRYRIKGNGVATITVSLRQGSDTEIASWPHATASTTTTTHEQTLTSGQADSITDYSDLRLRFVTFTP